MKFAESDEERAFLPLNTHFSKGEIVTVKHFIERHRKSTMKVTAANTFQHFRTFDELMRFFQSYFKKDLT